MKQLTLIIVLLATHYFALSQSAAYYAEKSEQKLKEERYLDALELIDKAIKLDNNNFWYYLKKSEIKVGLRQYYEALEDIRQAIAISPGECEPYNWLALLFQSIGQKDSALANYAIAMKYAKTDTIYNIILTNRGVARLGFMEWELAIKDFEEVLKFSPDDIATLNNISTAYKKTNQLDKAIQSLEKILRIDSAFIGTYINLGMIYTTAGQYKEAMKCFDKALEIDNKEALALNNRGFLWYKMENYDRAIVDINKSLELYPSNSYAYKNRALAYFALRKIKEGCSDLAAADQLGFSKHYGDEVEELKTKFCR